MPKIIYVSKKGYASCPSCLSHIRLDAELEESVCPFCEEGLKVAARTDTLGGRALDVLRGSRSGMLAAALAGAGLSLTMACGEPDPVEDEEEEEVNVQENPYEYNNLQDYGDFPDQDWDYEYNNVEPGEFNQEPGANNQEPGANNQEPGPNNDEPGPNNDESDEDPDD